MQDIDIGQITEALNDKMDRDSQNANPALAREATVSSLQTTVLDLQVTVSGLQGTVTYLQGVITKMLGRINYSDTNKVEFEITGNNSGFNTTYTIPSDGYIYITLYDPAAGTNTMYINDFIIDAPTTRVTMTLGNFIPVSKNDVLKCKSSVQVSMKVKGIFIPQKS